MPNYVRTHVPGATCFFTVALQARGTRTLTEHADVLRECVVAVRRRHPFRVEAMVVMPDHIHALWPLPAGDANSGLRWGLIKRTFTQKLIAMDALPAEARCRRDQGERTLWQHRFWEHLIAPRRTTRATSTTSISIL